MASYVLCLGSSQLASSCCVHALQSAYWYEWAAHWIPGAWDGHQKSVAEAEHASEGGKEINLLTLSTRLDWEAKLLRDEYLWGICIQGVHASPSCCHERIVRFTSLFRVCFSALFFWIFTNFRNFGLKFLSSVCSAMMRLFFSCFLAGC